MIAAYALAAGLLLNASADKPAYMPGETVKLRAEVKNTGSQPARAVPIEAVIRYAGGKEVARKTLAQAPVLEAGKSFSSQPLPVWTVPATASLGLYEVEVRAGEASARLPRGIVVYRQQIALEFLQTEQNTYTAGDVVRVRARIKNISGEPLSGLKLQLGSGFPWISGFTRGAKTMESPTIKVYTYPRAINLKAGETADTGWFESVVAALDPPGKPDIVDMFCWITDAEGLKVYKIDLTGTFTIYPPNYEGPMPFHPYYALYKFLADTDYRGASYKDIESYDDTLPPNTPKLGKWMAFAPHYDDEQACFPLIAMSRSQNVPFHIVHMTAGDGNVVSVHRHVDGLTNCPDFHTVGYLRYWETQKAYEIFGVKKEEVDYLGLPDGGSYSIFHDTSGKDVYLATTGTDHSPYAYAYRKNLPYNRQEVIRTLVELIRKYKPSDIYTPHPEERHGDHRTTTSFVLEALRQLRKEAGYQPRVHVWVGYGSGEAAKDNWQLQPEPPLPLTDRTLIKQHFAGWAYQSQFTILERGGRRLPLEELRKRPRLAPFYLLLNW